MPPPLPGSHVRHPRRINLTVPVLVLTSGLFWYAWWHFDGEAVLRRIVNKPAAPPTVDIDRSTKEAACLQAREAVSRLLGDRVIRFSDDFDLTTSAGDDASPPRLVNFRIRSHVTTAGGIRTVWSAEILFDRPAAEWRVLGVTVAE